MSVNPLAPEQAPPLTPQEIAEIQERCDEATRGPWFDGEGIIYGPDGECLARHGKYIKEGGFFTYTPDSQFVVNARTDLPRALATIAAQAREIEELRAALAGMVGLFPEPPSNAEAEPGKWPWKASTIATYEKAVALLAATGADQEGANG